MELAKTAAKDAAVKAEDALKNKRLPTGIDFKVFPAFTQSNPMAVIKEKNGYNVLQTAGQTQQGSISKVTDTPDGAIIVYVKKIIPPAKKEFEKQKITNLTRYREIVQQAAWANYLLMLKKQSNTVIKVAPKKKRNNQPQS